MVELWTETELELVTEGEVLAGVETADWLTAALWSGM